MSSSLRYQFTYCNLLYTLTNNYLFLLTLTLIFPQNCYVCLVFLFNMNMSRVEPLALVKSLAQAC